MSHGADGLRQAAEDAVLNANYIMARAEGPHDAGLRAARACTRRCSTTFLKDTGVTTLDFAKAMIDEGYHPMTMYFPLVVHGAMLIEPTESRGQGRPRPVHRRAARARRARQERDGGRGASRPRRFRPAPAPRRDAGRAQAGATLAPVEQPAGRRSDEAGGRVAQRALAARCGRGSMRVFTTLPQENLARSARPPRRSRRRAIPASAPRRTGTSRSWRWPWPAPPPSGSSCTPASPSPSRARPWPWPMSAGTSRRSGGRGSPRARLQVRPHNERRFSVPWSPPAPRMREYVAGGAGDLGGVEGRRQAQLRGQALPLHPDDARTSCPSPMTVRCRGSGSPASVRSC